LPGGLSRTGVEGKQTLRARRWPRHPSVAACLDAAPFEPVSLGHQSIDGADIPVGVRHVSPLIGQILTVCLRFPNGYILPPHMHPSDEHITVLQGTFLLGMGKDFSRGELVAHPVDGFVTAPANMAHFATTRGITEVQVHAIGPFELTYVHPEDDPTTKT
jgi:hypothetical protein